MVGVCDSAGDRRNDLLARTPDQPGRHAVDIAEVAHAPRHACRQLDQHRIPSYPLPWPVGPEGFSFSPFRQTCRDGAAFASQIPCALEAIDGVSRVDVVQRRIEQLRGVFFGPGQPSLLVEKFRQYLVRRQQVFDVLGRIVQIGGATSLLVCASCRC